MSQARSASRSQYSHRLGNGGREERSRKSFPERRVATGPGRILPTTYSTHTVHGPTYGGVGTCAPNPNTWRRLILNPFLPHRIPVRILANQYAWNILASETLS